MEAVNWEGVRRARQGEATAGRGRGQGGGVGIGAGGTRDPVPEPSKGDQEGAAVAGRPARSGDESTEPDVFGHRALVALHERIVDARQPERYARDEALLLFGRDGAARSALPGCLDVDGVDELVRVDLGIEHHRSFWSLAFLAMSSQGHSAICVLPAFQPAA